MVCDSKKYECIPPEGGWGYFIICGMVIPIFCAIGSVPSFGLIFSDLLNNIDAKADAVAVITSVFFILTNFSGNPRSFFICANMEIEDYNYFDFR